jgi:hypothetical protein
MISFIKTERRSIRNTDQLRKRFPDENTCWTFLESIIWRYGRFCAHCGFERTYRSIGEGVSSVFLTQWIGVTQKTVWKLGYGVRKIVDPDNEGQPMLGGTVELDEKYFGGTPRHKDGVRYKRGKGTQKQALLMAVERHGVVRMALTNSEKTAELLPWVERLIQKDAHLMSDENHAYRKIGRRYASHSWVKHSMEGFARGDVHKNTAEAFSSLRERAKSAVFPQMSTTHLRRYLNEIGFRWDHRLPKEK